MPNDTDVQTDTHTYCHTKTTLFRTCAIFMYIPTSEANTDCPIISAKWAYSRFVKPAPYFISGSVSTGRNRFHKPWEWAFSCVNIKIQMKYIRHIVKTIYIHTQFISLIYYKYLKW